MAKALLPLALIAYDLGKDLYLASTLWSYVAFCDQTESEAPFLVPRTDVDVFHGQTRAFEVRHCTLDQQRAQRCVVLELGALATAPMNVTPSQVPQFNCRYWSQDVSRAITAAFDAARADDETIPSMATLTVADCSKSRIGSYTSSCPNIENGRFTSTFPTFGKNLGGCAPADGIRGVGILLVISILLTFIPSTARVFQVLGQLRCRRPRPPVDPRAHSTREVLLAAVLPFCSPRELSSEAGTRIAGTLILVFSDLVGTVPQMLVMSVSLLTAGRTLCDSNVRFLPTEDTKLPVLFLVSILVSPWVSVVTLALDGTWKAWRALPSRNPCALLCHRCCKTNDASQRHVWTAVWPTIVLLQAIAGSLIFTATMVVIFRNGPDVALSALDIPASSGMNSWAGATFGFAVLYILTIICAHGFHLEDADAPSAGTSTAGPSPSLEDHVHVPNVVRTKASESPEIV